MSNQPGSAHSRSDHSPSGHLRGRMQPDQPVRLQYWSASREARPEDAIDFDSVNDAIAFAMTQRPGNREVAWIRTPDGDILLPPRIMSLWELRRHAA